MARNYFSRSQGGDAMDIINAGQQGWEDADNRFKSTMATFATAKAGRQYADGDRRGAARTFAGSGMIDQARLLESDQVAADTRRSAAEKARRDAEIAAEKAQAEESLKLFGNLRTVEPAKRRQFLQQNIPQLRMVGFDDETIQQVAGLTDEQLSDEGLNGILGSIVQEYDKIVGGPKEGVYGIKGSKFTEIMPPREEDFTLAPDQIRYNARGEVVARGGQRTSAPGRGRGGFGVVGGAPSGGKPWERKW